MSVTFALIVLRITCETRHNSIGRHCYLGNCSSLNPGFHLFLVRFLVVNCRYLCQWYYTLPSWWIYAKFPLHCLKSTSRARSEEIIILIIFY